MTSIFVLAGSWSFAIPPFIIVGESNRRPALEGRTNKTGHAEVIGTSRERCVTKKGASTHIDTEQVVHSGWNGWPMQNRWPGLPARSGRGTWVPCPSASRASWTPPLSTGSPGWPGLPQSNDSNPPLVSRASTCGPQDPHAQGSRRWRQAWWTVSTRSDITRWTRFDLDLEYLCSCD